MTGGWRWPWRAVLVGGVVTIGILLRTPILMAFADWLDVGSLPEASDYVFVLGGGEETREFVAAALLKSGLAKKILVPRDDSGPQEESLIYPSMQEVIRRILVYRGVPLERIATLDRAVSNTHDEALALSEFLRTSPDAKLTVVTSDYHTRRARWVFRRVLGKDANRLSFVSAPSDEFDRDEWWCSEEGFNEITGEYLKLTYYFFRYSPVQAAAVGVGSVTLFLLLFFARRGHLRRSALGPQT